MDLYDAESLLDGGTTCLTVVERSKKLYYTVDYSLPMDGRPRFVFVGNSPFSRTTQLEINSEKEKQIVEWLKNEMISNFGEVVVMDLINGKPGNIGQGKWLFALNFLRIISKERDYF
ncbi:MAG: hypothetical protein ACXACP_03860 [Candidatus Hodarchaeales archaeon]|jgi:hypothetical protein